MNDILNKVTQNYMDTKYEDSIMEVAQSLNKYVSAVNDQSATLYQDFNQNLKDAFGMNMQQIQDTIANITEELSAAKGQITVLTNLLEAVDINGRKSLSELNDKMEVGLLLSDLVSRVAEQ